MTPEQKIENLFNHVTNLCKILNDFGFKRKLDRFELEFLKQQGANLEIWDVEVPEHPILTFDAIKNNKDAFLYLKHNGYIDIGTCWLCGDEPIENKFTPLANELLKQSIHPYFICEKCYNEERTSFYVKHFEKKGMDTFLDTVLPEIAEAGKSMFDSQKMEKPDWAARYEVSNEALFEALLFSSIYIINTYEVKRPDQYEKFLDDYYDSLENWAKYNGVYEKIQGNYDDFISGRFELFRIEKTSQHEFPPMIRTKTAYCFYGSPLSIDVQDFKDLHQTTLMEIRTNGLLKKLDFVLGLLLKFDYKNT